MDELNEHPLARSALEELCAKMVTRGMDRGAKHAAAIEAGTAVDEDHEMAVSAPELGIEWGRLGFEHARQDALLRSAFPACLNTLAYNLDLEITDLRRPVDADDPETAELIRKENKAAAVELCQRAIEIMEEAVACLPDDQTYVGNLGFLRNLLLKLEYPDLEDILPFGRGSGGKADNTWDSKRGGDEGGKW
jgi:hypothetical protein